MNEYLIYSLINTLLLVLIIPIIGYLIGILIKSFVRFIASIAGRGFALFVANYLTFVGVAHHELSHALFGFISGAKITKISLFHPEGQSLGKVEMIPRGNFVTKSMQLTLSSIAPVVMGTVTEFLLYQYVWSNISIIWQKIILVYVMISIFLHMTMSSADIKNALKGLPICALIIFAVVYLTGFNILPFTLEL